MSVLGNFDRRRSTVIVGGGLSGLILGHYLKKKNLPFILYEKNLVGGLISTKEYPQGFAESAANAIFASDEVLEFLSDLKLEFIPATKKLRYWIYRKKALRIPLSLIELIRVLFNLSKKIPSPVNELTLFEALSPLMGQTVCTEVLSTVFQGIYASNAQELHFASLFLAQENENYFQFFRRLLKKKKENKKTCKNLKSLSFVGGMQTLVDCLRKELSEHIKYKAAPIDELLAKNEFNIILCTNSIGAMELLKNSAFHKISLTLKNISYSPITVATLFLSWPIEILENSFGILFSPHSGFQTLGIINNRAIFPHSTKKGFYSYNFIMKGVASPQEAVEFDYAKICSRKLNWQKAHLHFSAWDQGIPIYNLQRFKSIEEIKLQLSPTQGLLLFGNYTGSLSLRDLVGSAKKFTATL